MLTNRKKTCYNKASLETNKRLTKQKRIYHVEQEHSSTSTGSGGPSDGQGALRLGKLTEGSTSKT